MYYSLTVSLPREARSSGNKACLRRCCGQILVVHDHSSLLEVKLCDRKRRALCNESAKWPGNLLPEEGPRGLKEEERDTFCLLLKFAAERLNRRKLQLRLLEPFARALRRGRP